MYNIAGSHFHEHSNSCACCEDHTANAAPLPDGAYLFKTPTCPKCKIAIPKLQQAGIEFTEINAYENEALAIALNIKTAPTLVIVDDGEINMYSDLAAILDFTASLKKA